MSLNISNREVVGFLKSVICLNDKDLNLVNLRNHYLKIIESSKKLASDFLLTSYSFGYISDDELPLHLNALKEVGVDTVDLTKQISTLPEHSYALPISVKEDSKKIFPESFYGVVNIIYFQQKSLIDIEKQLNNDLEEQAPTISMSNCSAYQVCNKLLTSDAEWADSNYDQPVFVDRIKHLKTDQFVRAELFKILGKESFNDDLLQWMKDQSANSQFGGGENGEFTLLISKG